MSRVPRWIWPRAAVAILACLALAMWGRAAPSHYLVALALSAGLLGCAAVVSILRLLLRKHRAALGRVSLPLVVLALSALASLPVGQLLLRGDVAGARAYCDRLTTRLEDAHKQAGRYPFAVQEISENGERLPRLLEGHQFYVSDGESYLFSFHERNGVNPDEHLYSSESESWISR